MPAQISSILDGPAGPPPAIDKPSLRRLADAISALPESRLAALVQLLVKSGITEHDATLNLDLESLPIRVFRQVWHCVYDPSASGSGSDTPKRTVLVAHVKEEDPKHSDDLRSEHDVHVLPGPSSLKADPDEHKGIHTPAEEDDELQDDDESAPGPSSVPSKRKAPSSSSSKQKRHSFSPSPTPLTTHPTKIAIKCTYVSPIPDFLPCTRTFSRVADMRRHIEHQHAEEEAQATIDGRITKSQAKLLGEDWKGTIKKPTCEGCGQTFSRKDAVKRHQTETGARIVDGVCVSCPGSGNGSGAGKKRARRK
ncbi:hypothetical protein RSOLAG22IIIB_05637 [Rhizoctonia solani]|uniref:C2H2-type domain-containing protein n=1 Tax=Rhizoctonia solani TaxID=456999 RepID=A0A0K6G8F3_9AGAM|nr:hypothetical protein RSOLAG22IIIB_05637 [Rhizoctonia solani]